MRLNRKYQECGEFKTRQGRFDFAVVAHAVLEIAVSVKKALGGWWAKVRPVMKKAKAKHEQLKLNFASIQEEFQPLGIRL